MERKVEGRNKTVQEKNIKKGAGKDLQLEGNKT